MSVHAISWALGVDAGDPGSKCLLLVLANYADEHGRCWPSQQRLATESNQSLDTVQRKLRSLVKRGLIERQRRCNGQGGGRGRSADLYELAMDRPKPQSAALNRKRDLSRTAPGPKPQIARTYKEEPSSTVKNKPLQRNGTTTARAGKGCSWPKPRGDDGLIETQLAERLGIDGWDILGALSDGEREQLVMRQRRGRLSDADLLAVRADHG